MMPWGGMMGWGGGFGMLLGSLVNLALVVAVIVAAIAGIRWLSTTAPTRRAEGGDAAIEVLRRRYAAGEIEREEFEAKKRDLLA